MARMVMSGAMRVIYDSIWMGIKVVHEVLALGVAAHQ